MTLAANTGTPVADLRDVSTIGPDGTIGDTTWAPIAGVRVVLEHVVRAWFSPRGTVRHAPNRGIDLARLENGTFDLADLARLRGQMIAEARKVDYVIDARVLITLAGTRVQIQAGLLVDDGTRRVYPLAITIDGAVAIADFTGGLAA